MVNFSNRVVVLVKFFVCIHLVQCVATFQNGKISAADPVVYTKYGPVRGRPDETIEKKKPYIAFQGIPYARPPINELRFEPPVPPDKWTEVLNATSDRSECVQGLGIITGSEDCLYINVYVPYKSRKLSTMVWIHGGLFFIGSSQYIDYGPDYLLDEDIIFVSFNYRLGIFGFLSTGDLVAPGNIGLKDQFLALKWVKENIEYFNGDPNDITIAGQSAGAVGVSYMLQNPASKGLYQAAIMESGSSLCPWSLSRRAKELAEVVGRTLGVDTSTSHSLVKGLKEINYSILQKVSLNEMFVLLFQGNILDGLIIAPVTEPAHEGAIITGKSHEILESEIPFSVPTLMGTNSLETNLLPRGSLTLMLAKQYYSRSMLTPIDMNIENETLKYEVTSKIKKYYFGSLPLVLADIQLQKFARDFQFFRPIQETVRLLSKYESPVYYYRFEYEGLVGVNERRLFSGGVAHAEELLYLFRSFVFANPRDELTRSRMTRLWTNFVKYRNPTPTRDPLLGGVQWPDTTSISNDTLTYLSIDNELSSRINPKEGNWKFWKELYDMYGKPPFDTY